MIRFFIFLFPLLAFAAEMKTSMIVPCYAKHFPLIPDLLSRLKEQTAIPDEVVICLTKHQAAGIPQSDYDRVEKAPWPFAVKVVFTENSFPGAARNEACSQSTGDLLLCQDADDVPHPQRVELIKYLFENFPIELLVHRWAPSGYEFIPYTREESKSRLEPYYTIDQNDAEAFIHHGNACLTRAVFEKIKWSQTPTGEDHRFLREAFRHFSGKVFLLDERLVIYRPELSSYKNRFGPQSRNQ